MLRNDAWVGDDIFFYVYRVVPSSTAHQVKAPAFAVANPGRSGPDSEIIFHPSRLPTIIPSTNVSPSLACSRMRPSISNPAFTNAATDPALVA